MAEEFETEDCLVEIGRLHMQNRLLAQLFDKAKFAMTQFKKERDTLIAEKEEATDDPECPSCPATDQADDQTR